jgi:nitrilase
VSFDAADALPDLDLRSGWAPAHIVRVAAVQAPPVFLDLSASVARAEQFIRQAAQNGASLVAFAESWLPGYPEWVTRGMPWEDREMKELYARFSANALDPDGPEIPRLAEAAAQCRVVVVIGVTERDPRFSRGTLLNSLLLIDEQGTVRTVHRKLMPTHAERIIWGLGDASGLQVQATAAGRIGGLICWEHWMPLARFAMHAQGEQIHVAAWPDLPDMNLLAVRSYAFEGRCYVVAPGTRLLGSDLPRDLPAAHVFGPRPFSADTVLLRGGSVIVGPDSAVIAQAGLDTDVLYADLDLDRIPGELQSMDVAGHYNRPDVFQLHVNTARPRPVEFDTSTAPAGGDQIHQPEDQPARAAERATREWSTPDGTRLR